MRARYSRDKLIGILKKRDLQQLNFYEQVNGKLGTLFDLSVNEKADDDVEILIHTPENMMDETVDRVIDLLEHLEECIQRAYVWLSKQNLCDRWLTKSAYSPQELEQLFTICELDIEEAGSVLGNPKPGGGVFVMRFAFEDTKPMNPYPWHHDIYFDCDDLQPYMSEKDLW